LSHYAKPVDMGSLTTNRGATGAIFNDSRFSEFKQFVSQDREKD